MQNEYSTYSLSRYSCVDVVAVAGDWQTGIHRRSA